MTPTVDRQFNWRIEIQARHDGEPINIYDDNLIWAHMMCMTPDKRTKTIGFYGKGKKEQQQFFYNPCRKNNIIRMDKGLIVLQLDPKDKIFTMPGTHKLWIRLMYKDTSMYDSEPCELVVT